MENLLNDWQSAWSPVWVSVICVAFIATVATLIVTGAVKQAALRHTISMWSLVACVVGPIFSGWVVLSGIPLVALSYPVEVDEEPGVFSNGTPSATKDLHRIAIPAAQLLEPEDATTLSSAPINGVTTKDALRRPNGNVMASMPVNKRRSLPWGLCFVGLWVSGALIGLVRLTRGIMLVNGIVKRGQNPENREIGDAAAKAAEAAGLTRLPTLVESSAIVGPAVVGYRSMSVVLPKDFSRELEPNELQAVLTHEFAHVQRRDTWMLLAQSIIRCVYWPIVPIHALCESLSRAREEICDNYVLRVMSAQQYGQTLLKLGERAMGTRTVQHSVGILNWSGKLENRIAGLLDDRRSKTISTSRGRACLVALAFLVMALIICGTRPTDATASDSKTTDAEKESLSDVVSIPDGSKYFQATITDDAGVGIANAKVELWQLAYSSGSKSPPNVFRRDVMTDESGKASVPYPPFIDDSKKLATRRLGLRVSHQNFPGWSDYLSVEHTKPIQLATPMWAEVSVTSSDNRAITQDLLPVGSTIGKDWRLVNGKLRMGPLDLTKDRLMRIAHAPDGKAPRFSKLLSVSEADCDGNQVSLEVALEDVASVKGRLSGEVPRPVKNGFVLGTIVRMSESNDRWYFSERVPIAEDGTFVFSGLSRDENLQLLAICDGWLSLPPRPSEVAAYSKKWDYEVRHNNGASTGRVTTQLHRISADEGTATIQMHPTGSAAITVVDWDDKPIEGVSVAFYPNQAHHNAGSQGLGVSRDTLAYLKGDRVQDNDRDWVAQRYSAITDANGLATVHQLPSHQSCYADDDGKDRMSGQFISFHVTRKGYRLVATEPQRVISFGSSTPRETIDMVPGKTAQMRVRMEPVGAKPLRQRSAIPMAAIKNLKTQKTEGVSRDEDADEPTTVSIQGTARDPFGTAIAGATVHLIYENKDQKQTTTDSEGKYSFSHLVEAKSRTVQVFATAPDYGLSWHGKRSIASTEKPETLVNDEQCKSFYRGEPVVMNIQFMPRTSMSGRIRDGEGQPIEGARVSIRSFDYLKTEGMMYHHNFREIRSQAMPAHLRSTKTASDGRFSIEGLPLGAVAYVSIEHDDYAKQSMYVAMAAEPIDEYTFASNGSITIRNRKQVESPVMKTRSVSSCPLDLEFVATRSVKIRVVDSEGTPQSKVFASAGSGDRATGTHAYDKTGADGLVTLALPPGEYKLSARPPRESHFVPTTTSLTISKNHDPASVTDFPIQQGCLLQLKAVDSKTGEPISGMSFWKNLEFRPGARSGLNSSPSYVDHPKTGKDGMLNVIVKPGTHQIGVGWSDVPPPYQGGGGGREVQCQEGAVVALTFECRAY